MGSSTRNLPLYTEVFTAKLKLPAIEDLSTLISLVKKFRSLSVGIIVFLGSQNTTFWPKMTFSLFFMILGHGLFFITKDDNWNVIYR